MQTGCIGETPPASSERAEGNTEGRPAPCTTHPARISRDSLSEFLETAQVVDAFATLNYSKRKHINSSCVEAFLNGKGLLVPVTTEAFVPRSSATAARVSGRRIYRDDHTPAPGNGMKI